MVPHRLLYSSCSYRKCPQGGSTSCPTWVPRAPGALEKVPLQGCGCECSMLGLGRLGDQVTFQSPSCLWGPSFFKVPWAWICSWRAYLNLKMGVPSQEPITPDPRGLLCWHVLCSSSRPSQYHLETRGCSGSRDVQAVQVTQA